MSRAPTQAPRPAVSVPAPRWPVVELLFDVGASDRLATFVRSLALVARPSAPDHANVVAARLLSSPRAPGGRRAVREHHIPYAVVVSDPGDLDHEVTAAAAVIVADGDPELAGAAGPRAVLLSATPIRVAQWLPVPPFVRERLRRRQGLDAALAVDLGAVGTDEVNEPATAAVLRCAAAVVLRGPLAVTALALGCPMVTDAETAGNLGAVDGEHLLVAEGPRAAETAKHLASDRLLATRLSRAARELVEQRHDTDRLARTVAERLGLRSAAAAPAAVGLRLADHLRTLGTPRNDPYELRLARRLATLGVAPRSGGSWR